MLCETSHSSWVGACQQQQQLSACFTAAARYNIKQILNVQMLKDELEGKVHLEIKMQSVYSLLVPKFSAAVHKTFLYNRIKTLFTTFCQPRSPPQLLSVSARLEGVNSISSIHLGIWGASGGLDYCTDELYRDISWFFFVFFMSPSTAVVMESCATFFYWEARLGNVLQTAEVHPGFHRHWALEDNNLNFHYLGELTL